ncbi:MAG: tetratricopeptide repeat protein [Deltaproteobacteria bacterium]|nr:tetratricopeptide repeat protein [Deltaproteobacteria bacterium]
MMRRNIIIFLCLSFVFVLSPRLSHGDEQNKDDASLEVSERAKESFTRGNVLFGEKKYTEASEAFREAVQLMPSWKLYYNIAQSEAAAKRFGIALEYFEKYMTEGGDDVPEERLEEVLKEVRRLRMMVGSIKIYGDPGESRVMVDGIMRARLPLAAELRVSAGISHKIEIIQGDKVVYSQNITVGSGNKAEISLGDEDTVKPEPALISEDTPDVAASEPVTSVYASPLAKKKKPLLVAGSIFGAVGISAGGVALGFLIASNNKYDEFSLRNDKIEMGEIAPDDSIVRELKDDIATYDKVALSMAITSGVMLATAITLIVLHATKNKKIERLEASAGGLTVRF